MSGQQPKEKPILTKVQNLKISNDTDYTKATEVKTYFLESNNKLTIIYMQILTLENNIALTRGSFAQFLFCKTIRLEQKG